MKSRFLCSVLPGSIAVMIFAQSAHAATVFWSGGGTDANAGTSGNWFNNGAGQFQPNPGDAIVFNNTTGSNFTINMNYGANSFFDSFKSFTGAGAITLTGDRTFLYVFENNNNASLLKATADLSNRTGPDSDLSLNALGTGGVEVTNVIMQNGRQLIFNGPNTITVGGIISQTGVGNATTSIIGGATVVYRGANSYSGDTFVNSGKLQFATGGSANNSVIRIGDTTGTTSATVELTPLTGGLTLSSVMGSRLGSTGTAAIASLNTSGSNTLSNQIYLDKALAITQAAGGTLNITQAKGVDNTTGTDIKNQALTLTAAAGGTINHSGTIYNSTGNGTLTANGAGTVILSGVNTYTGTTAVQNGTLILRGGADNRLATTSSVSVGSAATIGILQLGDSNGISNQTLAGLTRVTQNAAAVVGGNSGVSTLTLNIGTGTNTYDAVLGGAGTNQNNLALTKTGAGNLALTASSTYTGTTQIRDGSITILAGDNRISQTSLVLGDSTTSGLLVLGNTSSARSQTVSSITTSGTGTSNRVVGAHATNFSNLTVNNSATVTYDGFLGGSGTNQNQLNLVKSGTGTLVLTQANTYAGTTTVNFGAVLRAANNNAFGTSAVILSGSTGLGGTTLELANGITINRGLTILNNGDNKTIQLQDGATSGEYSGAITVSETSTGDFDLLAFAGGTLTVSGQIGASAGANINKEGVGTVIVSGNNTLFDKSVSINAGVLRAGNNNAFGSTGGINLANTDTTLELANGVTINRGLTIFQAGDKKTLALTAGATAAEYSGAITINESTHGNVEMLVGASGNLTVSGAVGSSQSGGLTKTGAGTLVLSSASNNYAGNTTISGGTLRYGVASAIPNATAVTLNSAGTAVLDLNGLNGTIGSLTLGGSLGTASTAQTVQTGAGTLTLGGNLTTNATGNSTTAAVITGKVDLGAAQRNFSVADSVGSVLDLDVSATISGSVLAGSTQLAKTGAGTLRLSGPNSYVGNTSIEGGTLVASNNSAFGTGNLTLTNTGSVLELANGITIDRALTIDNTGDKKTLALQSSSTATFSGAITNSETTAGNFEVSVGTSGTLTLSAAVSSNTLTKVGSGILVLSGSTDNSNLLLNASSGQVNLDKGVAANVRAVSGISGIGNGATVKLTGAGTDQIFGGNGPNQGVNGIVAGGTLDLNGKTESVSFLNGSGGTVDGAAAGGSGTSTLTVGESSVTSSFAGVIINTTGTLNLAKTGSGTQTLSGPNTYSGTTTVSGGKLLVTDSIVNSAVTVSVTGAILASDALATIGSTLAVNNGAILAVGDAANATTATATVLGATTLNNGSIFSWDIDSAGTSYDKLVTTNVLGQASPAGDAVFRIVVADTTFANSFWNADRTWTDIFTTNGTAAIASWATVFGNAVTVVNSSFTSITPTAGTFSITDSTLTWTAVPEPSSALVGLLVGAGLLRRRRA